MSIFHLAIPTHDLSLAKVFYTKAFGAYIGREYDNYVIFNFFGHQVVTHLNPAKVDTEVTMYPRHYGIIFDKKEDFDSVYAKCKGAKASFFEELFERFQNKSGWHFSFFVSDPSNNLIELKYYVNQKDIFN
ncbi:MAG: VOC family protein [Proteobacteria bacterium]|nr:VOC family protein [Pseudomonadota bacterium]